MDTDPSRSWLTDEQIARMTPLERHRLVARLVRAPGAGPGRVLRRVRAVRLGVMVAGTAALVPWIVYLAVSLPDSYEAHNWPATWVGFDLGLVLMMVTTCVLGLLRRRLVMLSAFSTGVMLVCDAWFDVMTSAPADRGWALASALLAELPLAALLTLGSLRVLRLGARHAGFLEDGESLWHLTIPRSSPKPEGGDGAA